MKRSLITVCLVFAVTACASERHDPDREEWIQLFDGESLDGWDIKITGFDLNENDKNTFRVENGLLRVSYDEYEEWEGTFGHIFYHEPFSYYRIAVEYRFIGEQVPGGPAWAFRNNGVMLHSQSAESMALDQDFPVSIELQLLGGDGENERPNGNLCTPGTQVIIDGALITQHCVQADAPTYHGDQWVRVEALVLGDSLIQHILEGEVVLKYSQPRIAGGGVHNYDPDVKVDGTPLTVGYIALQAESHPTEFRRIELLDLNGCMDEGARNYKSYYVTHDETRCEF